MSVWTQILFAMAGSCAFSILFQIRGARVAVCAAAGGAVWGAYLLIAKYTGSELAAYFVSAMAATLLAETLARTFRSPAAMFLVPAVIPLIPGGSLFYAMEALVRGNMASAGALGGRTAAVAGVIAVGIYAVSTLSQLIRPLEYRLRARARK